MSGLGIEPPFVMHFWGGRNAPTFAPSSYKGLRRRPQFYRAEGGALIRNESQAGRGSVFPSHPCPSVLGSFSGDWRPPESLSSGVCGPGTRSVESLLAEISAPMGVRTPAGVFQSVSVCRLDC